MRCYLNAKRLKSCVEHVECLFQNTKYPAINSKNETILKCICQRGITEIVVRKIIKREEFCIAFSLQVINKPIPICLVGIYRCDQ